jgi:cytidine deaminase
MPSPVTDEQLIERARAARDCAYAPYSGYPVGCALVAEGEIFVGANQENASLGATLCAERVAIAAAVMAGKRTISAVAVVTQSSPPAAPCGICRQALMEFAVDSAAVRVLLASVDGTVEETTLAVLLPRGFRRADLDEVI